MIISTMNQQPSNPVFVQSSAKDWVTLIKPGVMLLVLFSGATGLWLAPVEMNWVLQLCVLLSVGMGSAAGAIFNMVYDRDIDAVMKRTQKRPIITGAIAADDAMFAAIFLSFFSVSLLGLASNWLAASLLGFSIFFYAVVYTIWLKRHTPQNIVIGGAAGAFPPVIGWLAATGEAGSTLPWLLFLTIFLWTPPHFWALALYRSGDYEKVKVPMMPLVAGIVSTKKQMVAYTLILIAVTCAVPFSTESLGGISLIASLVLGLMFLRHAIIVLKSDDDKKAMRMFGFSILYLFGIFAAYLLDAAVISNFGYDLLAF